LAHNVVIPTAYGQMIVNRNASEFDNLAKYGFSVDHRSIELYAAFIACTGPDALILDVGACFGCFSLGFAKMLEDHRPKILAFEPQEWLANCIAGSIALNDLENIVVVNAAVGAFNGVAHVPKLDYRQEASFGSLPLEECKSPTKFDWVVQEPKGSAVVDMLCIDNLRILPRAIKIDTEGMEMDVLKGATNTIVRARPVIFAEHTKGDRPAMVQLLEGWDYLTWNNDCDIVAVPAERRHLFPEINEVTKGIPDNAGGPVSIVYD